MRRKFSSWKFGSLPLLLVGLAIVSALAYFVLVPPPPPQPDETWTRIQNEHVLRIGIDPSSPPFIMDDGTGKLSGLDIALANEMANAWGVKIQYVYSGFDGLYDALNAKQFDLVLSALPYNPNKTRDVFFSRTYFNGGPVLVVRGDDTTTMRLEDVRDRTIAVELGSNGDAVARRWQKRYNLDVRQFDTAFGALGALQRDAAHAAIVDPIALVNFQRAEGDTGARAWRIVGNPLADENYIIAVRRDSPTLLRELNALLNRLDASGRLRQLEEENF